MAPDLNSLPPSRSPSSASPRARPVPPPTDDPSVLPSSRSTSFSLQATAAMNAGLHHGERRGSSGSITRRDSSSIAGRRRSNVVMNLQHYDPNTPGPGEMINDPQSPPFETQSPRTLAGSAVISTGDPHHYRSPSLGEIHQELEQEQEAQVNRLLQQIRIQQAQLHQLQTASGQNAGTNPSAIDDSATPTSERSRSSSYVNIPSVPVTTRSPTLSARSPQVPVRSSFDLQREVTRSRTPSRTASPRARAASIVGEGGETWNLPPRDESAFYQAETQMLTRENQMLRMRIRELERQANEINTHSPVTREPVRHSILVTARSHSIDEDETQHSRPEASTGAETSKEE